MIQVLFIAASTPLAAAKEFEGKVVGISDGNTLTVLWHDRLVMSRLYGIDAPEGEREFRTKVE